MGGEYREELFKLIIIFELSTPMANWYINYCSPFMYKSGPTLIYRIIMYSEIFALVIVYFIFRLLFVFASRNYSITQRRRLLWINIQRGQISKILRDYLKCNK